MVWTHNFRLGTLIAFPAVSLIVQYVVIFKQICTYYKLDTDKTNRCHLHIGASMAGLIVLHTIIDAFAYCLVRLKAIEVNGGAPVKKKEEPAKVVE